MEKCEICGCEIDDDVEGFYAHLVYDVLICEECAKTEGESYEANVGELIRKSQKKNKNRRKIKIEEK